jgi:alanyl-tRNA synthetase
LRFDFTSENRLTGEQKRQVEEIVNTKITQSLPVSFTVLPLAEAEKTGAIHAFGEKYGDAVKVYSIGGKAARRRDGEDNERPASSVQRQENGKHLRGGGDSSEVENSGIKLAQESAEITPRDEVYSREFCGGPHVANTSEIKGTFKIQKDEKISRDVVRIKAILE